MLNKSPIFLQERLKKIFFLEEKKIWLFFKKLSRQRNLNKIFLRCHRGSIQKLEKRESTSVEVKKQESVLQELSMLLIMNYFYQMTHFLLQMLKSLNNYSFRLLKEYLIKKLLYLLHTRLNFYNIQTMLLLCKMGKFKHRDLIILIKSKLLLMNLKQIKQNKKNLLKNSIKTNIEKNLLMLLKSYLKIKKNKTKLMLLKMKKKIKKKNLNRKKEV